MKLIHNNLLTLLIMKKAMSFAAVLVLFFGLTACESDSTLADVDGLYDAECTTCNDIDIDPDADCTTCNDIDIDGGDN